ncbi:non-structural protein 1 [Snake adeno-associated virus]|uniref:Non-structural protein 1 n=1 Tax=Snake adeno-associated virus TaxID=252602 RepID=Q6V7U3_9VIRU|nr:non-structural protein 1 [Snake adeno-associated virus]AAR07954.1 non-structural protein 1 [Snake adeno-associated virus]
MAFYEVVFRLPRDNNNLLDEDRYQPELKEEDDWPEEYLTSEDASFIGLAYAVLSEIRRFFGKELQWFAQVEWCPTAGYHMHVLLNHPKLSNQTYGRKVNELACRIVDTFGLINPEEVISTHYVKSNYGHKKVRVIHLESYLKNYFFRKTLAPPNYTEEGDYKREEEVVLWAFTNIVAWKPFVRNLIKRSELATVPKQPENPAGDGPAPRVTAGTRHFMETIDWLVKHGITTEREFCHANRPLYLSMLASTSGAGQIKRALDQAKHMMTSTMSAEDYLTTEEDVIEPPTENRIYKIMKLNRYDPELAAALFYGWTCKNFGKRNTIWLYGPATTGKTIIAQAIAHAVKLFAGVNWTNENFPFCNCPGKLLIWWEEGKMTNKMVETAKCILGGSAVPVDIKGKPAEMCPQTPCIITSNTNMCQVYDGNSSSFEHQEPLEERMFMFRLNTKLPSTFGKITEEEVKQFITWGRSLKVQVPHQFRVPTTGEYKRPAPEAKAHSSDEPPKEKVARIDDSLTRYVNNIDESATSREMFLEIANTNQCMLHHCFSCTECYPELLDDMDKEQ